MEENGVRINKFLSEAGVCSRREADRQIEMCIRDRDWIVAIGGGSPIDAAKAMWIKYEYPDITFEDMCKVFGIPTVSYTHLDVYKRQVSASFF